MIASLTFTSHCLRRRLESETMARSLRFATLDVFATRRFRGNPLAVVFLPEDEPLSQEQKQLIAREFNYSETIFVHPTDSQQPNFRKIDIFTTAQELPFAGHPTIGATSWFLQQSPNEGQKPTTITTKAGDIPISISSEDPTKVSALIPHDVRIHSSRMPLAELLKLHPSLEQYLDAAVYADGFPVVSIVRGMTAAHVRLPSLEALNAVTTATGGHEIPATTPVAGGYLDPGWDVPGHVSVYFHVRDVWDEELQTKVIRSRMVAGILEDPATGSAASGLAAYLSLTNGERKGGAYTIVQGVEMGQRSEIGVQVTVEETETGIRDIKLQGNAVKVSEGHIFLDN